MNEDARLNLSFAALSDATRRGVLEQLGKAEASISSLAEQFHMTLTGMKKHVDVLERAELVSKHRVGRESIVRAEAEGLKRAHAALDRLESEWRGRIERIDRILDDKGDS